jgi:hypothetical protein
VKLTQQVDAAAKLTPLRQLLRLPSCRSCVNLTPCVNLLRQLVAGTCKELSAKLTQLTENCSRARVARSARDAGARRRGHTSSASTCV